MTRAIAATAIALALAGCQTVAIAGCDIYPARGITFSASQDSAETVRQIRETNAAFRAACGR